MTFLIDTNVLSEVTRALPEPRVIEWLDQVDEDRTYVSVASLAELRRGAMLLEADRRREMLADWLNGALRERFTGRILPIDEDSANLWGDLQAQSRRRGIALSVMDGFIAASALSRNLVVVTRNVRDFKHLGITVLNPWDVS